MRITSPKKAEAALPNKRRSRGSNTPEGKQRSSRGALQRGLRSTTRLPALIPFLHTCARQTFLAHCQAFHPFFNALFFSFVFWRHWLHRINLHSDPIPTTATYLLVLNLRQPRLISLHLLYACVGGGENIRRVGSPPDLQTNPHSFSHSLNRVPDDLPRAAGILSPANEPITPLESTKPLAPAPAIGAAPAPLPSTTAPRPKPQNLSPANEPITPLESTKPLVPAPAIGAAPAPQPAAPAAHPAVPAALPAAPADQPAAPATHPAAPAALPAAPAAQPAAPAAQPAARAPQPAATDFVPGKRTHNSSRMNENRSQIAPAWPGLARLTLPPPPPSPPRPLRSRSDVPCAPMLSPRIPQNEPEPAARRPPAHPRSRRPFRTAAPQPCPSPRLGQLSHEGSVSTL